MLRIQIIVTDMKKEVQIGIARVYHLRNWCCRHAKGAPDLQLVLKILTECCRYALGATDMQSVLQIRNGCCRYTKLVLLIYAMAAENICQECCRLSN